MFGVLPDDSNKILHAYALESLPQILLLMVCFVNYAVCPHQYPSWERNSWSYYEVFLPLSVLYYFLPSFSAEKIRPEKELDRAKSEILRCKFKIRELFRHLDSLSSEGRFEESLFDSKGQIDSEDVSKPSCPHRNIVWNTIFPLCIAILFL